MSQDRSVIESTTDTKDGQSQSSDRVFGSRNHALVRLVQILVDIAERRTFGPAIQDVAAPACDPSAVAEIAPAERQ
jgi:hypothetical protein